MTKLEYDVNFIKLKYELKKVNVRWWEFKTRWKLYRQMKNEIRHKKNLHKDD